MFVVRNQITKAVEMNILLQAISLLFLTASSDAPPPVPNFCGQAFCLELGPMLHVDRRGFVTIEKDLVELDGRSWMKLNYAGLGTVSVIGPFPASSATGDASFDEQTEEITVNSCMVDGDPKTCGRYVISITDNGVATRPLICSVSSFWPAQPEENSPDVRLGQRVDIGQQIAKRCL
jgi:hypothetical protein